MNLVKKNAMSTAVREESHSVLTRGPIVEHAMLAQRMTSRSQHVGSSMLSSRCSRLVLSTSKPSRIARCAAQSKIAMKVRLERMGPLVLARNLDASITNHPGCQNDFGDVDVRIDQALIRIASVAGRQVAITRCVRNTA
ncbi:hypothetical protein PTTW11_03582 [Pyrenophora teres f. teres]|uniref:Uncharacterized protein n=1 Tax=Pyrenophora teres f. teres TaxID=97479 RepID=A0A6S6VTH1_9PLEO|nr:hypothetical protein PTTW11_03582 [Pyrenophora teres f. teres]